MRVTQSMLSNSMLNNLSNSYSKLGKLQNQISTGSKLLRPSDDPVGVTKAMSYRTQLQQNEQYQDNLDTATKWLDMSDDALGQVTNAMTRVQELVTQAANDTNQTVDREKVLIEIQQIREEVKDISNTKVGDMYIFSGTRTNEPVYIDAKVASTSYLDTDNNVVEAIELYKQKDGSTIATARDADGNLVAKVTNSVEELEYDTTGATKQANTSAIITPTANLNIQVLNDITAGTKTITLKDNNYNMNSLVVSNDGTTTTIKNSKDEIIANIDVSGNVTDKDGNAISTTTPIQLDLNRSLSVNANGNVVVQNSENESTITINPTADVEYLTSEGTTINALNTGELNLLTASQTEIKADATGIVNIHNIDTTNNYNEKKESANKKIAQNLVGMDQTANVEIFNGIQLGVTTTGAQKMFAKLDTVFAKIETALKGDKDGNTSHDKLTALLGGTNSAADQANETIQGVVDLVLAERSTVGAKQNRVDMMADRLALQKEALTKQQSDVEDVEYEEVITNLITQESIHNAALSVGSKIIQQTLVDFM